MRRKKGGPLTIAYVLLVAFLFVAMIFVLYPRARRPIIPNVCPIDGQVAEWSKRKGRSDCEYGHFSAVEKTTHTWLAGCP